MNVNDEISAVVLTLDRQERKMSLGIKQLTEDPWTQGSLKDKYAIGTRHKGVVRNLTNFGLFIELEEGIDGLVHVSDLSWTKKIKHPSDFVKVNDELEVVVLELDADNRRLALGHKQLEENPWDTFETIFAVGSVHKSTIVAKGDKFATLELPYGIEGIAAVKNLTKEDGTLAEVGESLDFTVLEFLKDEKKIVLTHSKVKAPAPVVEEKKEEKPARTSNQSAPAKTSSNSDSSSKEGEKSTFGDLSVLSALKEQFEENEKKEKK